MVLAAEIGVEGWLAIIGAIGFQLTILVTVIINSRDTRRVHRDIKPPSNSVSLGALVEAIAQIQHLQVAMSHPDEDIPAAQTVGRRLQAAADAGEIPSPQVGGSGADRRVMRPPDMPPDRRHEKRPEH